MSSRRRYPDWRLTALALVLTGALLALGAVHPMAQLLLAGAIGVIGLVAARFGCLEFHWGSAFLTALGLITFAWAVPLPLNWVEVLNPLTAEPWSKALQLTGGEMATLSLEPEATRLEGLRLLGYGVASGLVVPLVRDLGMRRVVRLVMSICLLLGVLTVAHQLAGARHLYGFYRPENVIAGRLSPLLNPNNFAGLLNLGVFCTLALSLNRSRPLANLLLYGLGVAFLSAMSLTSASRAGGLTLVFGFAVLALVLVWHKGRKSSGQARLGTSKDWRQLVLGGVGALGFATIALTPQLTRELFNVSVDKIQLYSWGIDVALAHPWFGVGRGAFGAEAPRFQGSLVHDAVFSRVENLPLEWLTGWGLPVGGLALLFLAHALRPAVHLRGRSLFSKTVYVGCLMFVLHNFADLGSEIPALGLVFVVLLSALWANRKGCRPLVEERHWLVAWPLALLLITAVLFVTGVHLARHDRTALAKSMKQPGGAQLSQIETLLRRHPADFYILRMGALAAAEQKPEQSLRWLNAALLRNPDDARGYVLMGQLLQQRGHSGQAVVALRAALAKRPELAGSLVRTIRKWPGVKLETLVPEGEQGVPVLLTIAEHTRDLKERSWVAREVLARMPQHPPGILLAAATTIEAVEGNVEPCATQQAECRQRAANGLEHASSLGVTPLRILPWKARLLGANGQHRAGMELLLAECPRTFATRSCLKGAVALARPLSLRELKRAVDAYLDACSNARYCLSEEARFAKLFEQRGGFGVALPYYRRLADHRNTASAWLNVARVTQAAGRAQESLRALAKAEAKLGSEDQRMRSEIQRMRGSLFTPE